MLWRKATNKQTYCSHTLFNNYPSSLSAAESGKSHCPLCHRNFPLGEEAWKNHLMGKDGCKANPRRLQSINRKQAAGQPPGPGGLL